MFIKTLQVRNINGNSRVSVHKRVLTEVIKIFVYVRGV